MLTSRWSSDKLEKDLDIGMLASERIGSGEYFVVLSPKTDPVCIVLGNESCDMDSAVCALSLAFLYQNKQNSKPKAIKACNFLPILNIPRRDYPLKTEVKYIFSKYSITSDMLTFIDELSEDFLKANQFVLVDHHVSVWSSKSVAIFDHRPKDPVATIPENCEMYLRSVGSCSTLIAELFLCHNVYEKQILELLRSTIVLDTVNFSKEAARATPKDEEICSTLEDILKDLTNLAPREELFHALVKARSDVSFLTAAELLRKDLKVLASQSNNNFKLAIPGFPLPVQQFLLKQGAEDAVRQFANENNCSIILLMGLFVDMEDNSVHRDLGLICLSNTELYNVIKDKLVSLDEPKLLLELYSDCNFMNGSFYKQGNVRATRKHILPVIKTILDN